MGRRRGMAGLQDGDVERRRRPLHRAGRRRDCPHPGPTQVPEADCAAGGCLSRSDGADYIGRLLELRPRAARPRCRRGLAAGQGVASGGSNCTGATCRHDGAQHADGDSRAVAAASRCAGLLPSGWFGPVTPAGTFAFYWERKERAMPNRTKSKGKIEGEGSYSGAKTYDEATAKFVKEGKVKRAAKEA